MPDLTVRIPEQLCEAARSVWAGLTLEDKQDIESHYRHQAAPGGWRREGYELEGVKIRVWGSKLRSDDKAWLVLLDMAWRVGLRALDQGKRLLRGLKGGVIVHAFKLHDLELEQVKALPDLKHDDRTRGREAGVGTKLIQLAALGLTLLADKYKIEVSLCG